MKKELKKITNLTINEILNNEVILPSLYFEKFNHHTKELEINLDDEVFKQEIDSLIIEDFRTIERYMNSIMNNVSELKEDTKNAKNAILNKDLSSLSDIYKKMIHLEKEVKKLNDELFIDETTKVFNKKWIYTKFLDENALFKKNGICLLVDVVDYFYIQKEYGELLARNLLLFITTFISKKLDDEKYDIRIVRYFDNKFFIFILEEDIKEIENYISNLERMLLNTTLKSNSGLLIKANYRFNQEFFKVNEDSKNIFEKLLDSSNASK